jgi:hypothetical protein
LLALRASILFASEEFGGPAYDQGQAQLASTEIMMRQKTVSIQKVFERQETNTARQAMDSVSSRV